MTKPVPSVSTSIIYWIGTIKPPWNCFANREVHDVNFVASAGFSGAQSSLPIFFSNKSTLRPKSKISGEMQPTTSGSIGGASGGGKVSRGGLARFRSAPATWLEALLEDEEEDPLKQSQCLTQLLAGNSAQAEPVPADPGLFSSGSTGFLRQNSSPADFLGNLGIGSDNYFSNLGIPANYDYLPGGMEHSPAKLQSQMKAEQVGQLSGSGGSLIEMEMEKLLEDSVPCRVRAKRGFATHPRSIAERVRRTRISDRIRKLQELVPNMDKQTNTSDMLEEAVEYVKFLQKQIQELSEHQKKCTCVARDQGSGRDLPTI